MSFFKHVQLHKYDITDKGISQACYAEVVAEAKDTGDFPMYGEEMLRQSAQWKLEDIVNNSILSEVA